MPTRSRIGSTFFLFIWAVLLAAPSAAQECTEKGITTGAADVYAEVPQYVTGRGWQGSVFARLTKDTKLYICARTSVGFGLGSTTWCKIVFLENNIWKTGWVMEETVKTWASQTEQAPQKPHGLRLVYEAYAGTAAKDRTGTAWDLASPPPLDKIKEMPATAVSLKSESEASASVRQSVKLYWPLFAAMLLGMAAKAGVDLLYASSDALKKEHLRNGIVAFLISPMVFLGIMSAGEFKASGQTFFVLCLFAFQNGFFWQTLLKRPVTDAQDTEQRPATPSAAPGR